MAREQVGPNPLREDDLVDVEYIDARLAAFSGNSVLVTPDQDYELIPPSHPVGPEMVMFEIRPTVQAIVSFPDICRLTLGLPSTFVVPLGKSAFVGIRWSDSAGAWYVLAITVEA
jgi:hypothetical protein